MFVVVIVAVAVFYLEDLVFVGMSIKVLLEEQKEENKICWSTERQCFHFSVYVGNYILKYISSKNVLIHDFDSLMIY